MCAFRRCADCYGGGRDLFHAPSLVARRRIRADDSGPKIIENAASREQRTQALHAAPAPLKGVKSMHQRTHRASNKWRSARSCDSTDRIAADAPPNGAHCEERVPRTVRSALFTPPLARPRHPQRAARTTLMCGRNSTAYCKFRVVVSLTIGTGRTSAKVVDPDLTQRRQWHFFDPTTGLLWKWSLVERVEKSEPDDSSRSSVATTDGDKNRAERQHLKIANRRCRPSAAVRPRAADSSNAAVADAGRWLTYSRCLAPSSRWSPRPAVARMAAVRGTAA